jgi:hypothetical protein
MRMHDRPDIPAGTQHLGVQVDVQFTNTDCSSRTA